jgi:hypothetical protein
MNLRTPLFIVLAIISVTLIPVVNHVILKLGSALYRISSPIIPVCLFGPLVLVLGIMQCLGGKESGGFRSGMWYMVIGTIMITYALSFSFYGVVSR